MFQDAITIADIVLWAALYPILSDSSFEAGKRTFTCDFLALSVVFDVMFGTSENTFSRVGDLRFVRGWFDGVDVQSACQTAAQKVLHGKSSEALKTFLQKLPATQTQRRDGPTSTSAAEVLSHNPMIIF